MSDETPVRSMEADICLGITRLGIRLTTEFDQRLATVGLSLAQYRVLVTVAGHDPEGISPGAVAEKLLIERATVSVLAERLVKGGYLLRLPGENRRTHNLVLSDFGKQVLAEARPEAVGLAKQTLQNLERGDLWMLLSLLGKLESELRN